MTRPITSTGLAVKRLQVRHHRGSDEALAPLGLTLVQWDALRHLHEHPGASLRDLAALTFQSEQSTGELTNRMVKRGLLERVPGPGRAVRHRLTERGEQAREQGGALVHGVLTESFAALTPDELATFDALLQRLLSQ